MTDEELKARGLIRVPVGPFGLFGYRVISLKKFSREQRAKERRKARQKAAKARRRKAKLKRTAKKAVRQAVLGKKKKSKRKNLGFGLYWD